jgi:hypothetical protein
MQPMSRKIVGPVIATNLTPETSEKIIFLDDHRNRRFLAQIFRGPRGQHPARRTVTPTKSLTRACGRPTQESGYAIWDYRPCHYRNFLITM